MLTPFHITETDRVPRAEKEGPKFHPGHPFETNGNINEERPTEKGGEPELKTKSSD